MKPDDELPPLEPWVEDLLEADRHVPALAPGRVDAMLGRLETSIAVGSAALPAAATLTGLKVGLLAGAIGFAAGGVTGYVVRDRQAPPAPVAAPSPAPVPVAMPAPVPDAAPPAGAPDAAPAPRAPSEPSSAAEENLLSQAQSALARRRFDDALAATRTHERRFPRGLFTEEREALAIQALVGLGRRAEAEERARKFYSRFPGSLSTGVVRAALEAP